MENEAALAGESGVTAVDGRRARRERGRQRAMDAVIDLIAEGHDQPPPPELIAERAGVSIATLFRYFESLEAMRGEVILRYFERFAHLNEIPDVGVGSLDDRIANFVTARVELHEQNAPMARVARTNASTVPEINDIVDRVRSTHRDQIRHHFDDELRVMNPQCRGDMVALICTITSYESWDQIRNHGQRSPTQCRRAWTFALTQLLGR